jgi:hypothetical protein
VYGNVGHLGAHTYQFAISLSVVFCFCFIHFLKPNATIWRGYKIAKTFETLPSAQFAIHDVRHWATSIKCTSTYNLAPLE